MIKLAKSTECWTPQSSHGDTFFSTYLVARVLVFHPFIYNFSIVLQCSVCPATKHGTPHFSLPPTPFNSIHAELQCFTTLSTKHPPDAFLHP